MGHRTELPPASRVEVTSRCEIPGAADYARIKIGELSRLTHRPVLQACVKLTRHPDPAVSRPVVAQAMLDVDGRLVRAQVEGSTAREAIDRLQAKMRRQLERIDRGHARRREHAVAEMRDASRPRLTEHRPGHVTRPPGERRIVRRKSFAMAPCTIDEAVDEMDLLDYDFHLFTEMHSSAAGVVYRSGPTGLRVTMVAPALADQLGPITNPVTFSPQPTPCLTEEAAIDRIELLGLPFLFYIDAAQGRASLLYRRVDGHFGVIAPAG
ncbi:HPF/RaiA family ribosome-associated protein [Mycobacterium sp. NPDC050551]|uniref:ribosome hibernation promotion factor n=1 Tax=Mycobacterium sp. NPDC050551 TaxID=3155407 RepID=UPI0034473585